MAKSPRKRITQSIDLRPDSSQVIGQGVIPAGPADPPLVVGSGGITSLTTNPISPAINSNFTVTFTISGTFSDGILPQYKYVRANGTETEWTNITPTTSNSATFTLASGLVSGSASVSIQTFQKNILVDIKTLAFNIIGSVASTPYLFGDPFGGGLMQNVPWHGGIGSNYFAGGISFQDSNIISGDENGNITRSFFNLGTPLNTVSRRTSTTRTLDDDGITWEGEKTAVEKAAIFATESKDGIQFEINSYYEPAYVLGFRKFMIWSPSGNLKLNATFLPNDSVDFDMNGHPSGWFNATGSVTKRQFIQGSGGYAAASWTGMGISGSTAPDGTTLAVTDPWSLEMAEIGYYDAITTGYARPWTTNGYPVGWFVNGGNMVSTWNQDGNTHYRAKEGQERNRQYSWQTYFKTWVDSKAEIGDPVEVAIYTGKKVSYKTRDGATAGTTSGLDWGSLATVENIVVGGLNESSQGGWQVTGGISPISGVTAVTAGRQEDNFLSPFHRYQTPRVGSDSESWTSSGDKYFWDQQIAGWTGVGVYGFYFDASNDLPDSNPKFLEYLSNRNLTHGSEAWPLSQSVAATGKNRYFPQTWIGEIPYITICDNGSSALETRGWQNFNWTTGKQYHPRPDLGGIPGDGITPTGSDLVTIREATPGSGSEQPLVYIDGSTYDTNNKPTLYIKVVFGNGGASTTSGWNASFRLTDPATGANVRRTSDFFTTPVTFDADTIEVNITDGDYFDEIPRHFNELLMKNDLDKMIDYGYIPCFSFGYNDIDGQGLDRTYRNAGATREDISLLGRLQKYVNARLAGFSATDTEATQWLYLDLYNDDGSLITNSEVVIQSFTITADPVGVDGGGVTGSFTLNYYEGVTANIDWRVYFKEDS